MNKILELNSYSLYDELGNRDYMVYEVKYDDGHKEYVSRDVFRNLKALEIINKKGLSLLHKSLIISSKNYEEYRQEFQLVKSREFKNEYFYSREEFNLFKEVLL